MIMLRQDDCGLVIEGAMGVAQAATLLERGRARLQGPVCQIRLFEVTEVDSCAVALLLDWTREAQRRGIRLEIVGMPSDLKALAGVYGVLSLLPICEPEADSHA
jgi:phospholipid transport system transporter-binding protein